MRKMFQALVLTMVLLGQDASAQVHVTPAEMLCGETKMWFEVLSKEKFKPVLVGRATNKSNQELVVTVWYNIDLQKMTVTNTKQNLTCVVTGAQETVFTPPGLRL